VLAHAKPANGLRNASQNAFQWQNSSDTMPGPLNWPEFVTALKEATLRWFGTARTAGRKKAAADPFSRN